MFYQSFYESVSQQPHLAGINASLPMDYESDKYDRVTGSDTIRLSEASAIDWRTKGRVKLIKKF